MQNRITSKQKLLDQNGVLANPGYATDLLWDYNRKDIKAPFFKIKEWDYYLVYNNDYGIALTIADNSYMGLYSVSFLDFKNKEETTKTIMSLFPNGKTKMPSSSSVGNIKINKKKINIEFIKNQNHRILKCKMPNFLNNQPFECEITLFQPDMDTMVIATPFKENNHAFYYNQKINCMSATGFAKIGANKYCFNKENNSFGTLDWGRGVWTYKNTWYWGSASGIVNNEPFGFNLGYGFGDTSKATENMLFYRNKASKLDNIEFKIPKYDYMKPWKITSNDERFEMTFTPILDRSYFSSVGIILSDQHQIFGRFTGKAVLDYGEQIEIEDFLGFAEVVTNKW